MSTKANQIGQDSVPAVELSADFLAGSTEAGLEKIRTRLLDLTNRNRLLNFKHSTASSLRIVDVDMDVVFRRLLDTEKLALHHVPEPETVSRPKISAADNAETLGWRISYDLEEPSDNNKNSKVLPVLHYFEGLETLTRKIGSAAKTAVEESGTNMLFLILGFLEWYESDESQQSRFAPLLTVPVILDRGAGRGKGFDPTIEYSGEDFTTNLSLVEKMRRDFGLEIPSVDDDDTPEKYFARFSHIMMRQKRWRVRHQMTLTLLSFGKLLMYRDLDPTSWPGIIKHKLVKELFEGTKSETIAHAEEFSIDAPDLKEEVPPLILDADSSQHSALIHAMRGQNLVIEGPPGTGKSQTITNLIAAALVKGKTALFVAEKLAALEVVRRRLDEAGLGIFCLELHSNKSKKHALLNDVAVRIKAHGSFREPRELDQHSAAVEEKKRLLTHYVELINTPIELFQATIFEILWARERFHRELPFTRELTGQVPDALNVTRIQYAQKEHFLSVYAQHLTAVLRARLALGENPWAWITKTLTFEEEEHVIDLLARLLEAITDTEHQYQRLRESGQISIEDTANGARFARELLAMLPEPDQLLNPHLLEPCRDAHVRAVLQDFSKDVTDACETLRLLNESTTQPRLLLQNGITEKVEAAFEAVRALELQECTCTQLQDLLEVRTAAETTLNEAETCFAALQNVLGVDVRFDLPSVVSLLNCLRLIETAPLDVLHFRATSFESDGASHIVRSAADEARGLRARHDELNRTFDLSLVMGPGDPLHLAEHASALERAGILQVLFGRAYKRARRTYRSFAITRQKASRETMARHLRALSDHCQKRAQFEGHSLYRETLGACFIGVDSKWDEIRLLASWYEEVFVRLPEHDEHSRVFRELLLKSRTERLKGLRDALIPHGKRRASPVDRL
jgi:Protein of unknown function (DUF4011)